MFHWRAILSISTSLILLGAIFYFVQKNKDDKESLVEAESHESFLVVSGGNFVQSPTPHSQEGGGIHGGNADNPLPKALLERYKFQKFDAQTMGTLVRLAATLSLPEKPMEEVVSELRSLGIDVERRLAGTKEFGERIEFRGALPEKGLQSLLLIYQLGGENGDTPYFDKLIVGFEPETGLRDFLHEFVQGIAGESGAQEKVLIEKVPRFEWNDYVLWMKEYTKDNPHSGPYPETVMITFEHLLHD